MPAVLDRVIWNGDAGDVWTNDTAAAAYQFIAAWRHTCGVCAQYDHAISPYRWPIPLHRHCQCRQALVRPGAKGLPWVDFLEKARELGPEAQRALVGKSSWRIIEDGLVRWEDVVTRYRVRTFREVVSINRLSIDRLVRSGVAPHVARTAFESVHTAAHALVERQRSQLLQNLQQAGIPDAAVRDLAARGIVRGVGIGAGPGGASDLPSASSRLKDLLGSRLKSWKAGDAARLSRVVIVKPVKPPSDKQKPKAAKESQWLDAATAEEALKAFEAQAEQRLLTDSKYNSAKARAEAYEKILARFGKDVGEIERHGMASPEPFREVDFHGITFRYSPGVKHGSGRLQIHEQMDQLGTFAGEWGSIPARLKDSTRRVYLQAQPNKNDGYWAKAFGIPGFRSTASGGDGDVVLYSGAILTPRLYYHEAAHNLAKDLWGTSTPPATSDFAKAMRSGEQPVRDYGKVSASEDFSTSVELWGAFPNRMRREYPERFKVVDRLMKDPNYGG